MLHERQATMLSTPSTVGQRYRVLDLVGTGGMGSVYRVMDRLSRQTVALKRVTASPDTLNFASRADDSIDFRLALAQEFQILASLRHPNIIGVLDYGFDADNQPYYTMDLLEDAQTILDAARDESLSVKVALLAELLQALSYLHRRGIVHRDLKPSNVLVAGGQVKVLDFGLSVRTEQNRTTGGTSGTLAYMAPEVLNGDPASIAADLYAVGVIAYEILVGHHPFITTDVSQLVIAILTQEPELTATGLEPPFVELLSRLLAKEPANRYANTGAVLEALSAAASEPLALETQDIRESFLQAAQFVGRKDELAQLSDVLLHALTARKGSTWLVGGESGVGKSRLVEELRTLALVQSASVLRGQTVSEGGASYQLWRDSLRWLATTSELTDDEASILKPLVPDIAELLEHQVSDAPEIEAKAAVERVLSTIVNLIKRQTQPLLILLEDLQWASQEELAVLSRLKRAPTTLPPMILATYRDVERPHLPPSLPHACLIRLQPLSQAGTAPFAPPVPSPLHKHP